MLMTIPGTMASRSNVAEGSEYRILPSILVSEEYSDNIFLTTDNRSADFITRIAPALGVTYSAPYWDWTINYNYDYHFYAKRSINGDSYHTLRLTNRNRIIPDFLYLDVTDEYTRTSLDVLRDYSQESNFVRQSDRNIVSISPFMVVHPFSRMTITGGYRFIDTWYKDPAAVDRTNHIGYADLQQDQSLRSMFIAGIKHTVDENAREGFEQDDVYIGQMYEYADGSTATLKAGNSWFAYDFRGRTRQLFWEANFIQRFPTTTVFYETGLRFIPDPLGPLRREDRYIIGVSKTVQPAQPDRTVYSGSISMVEYRDAEYKNLESTSYRISGSISHSITTQTTIKFDASAERLENNPLHTYTERYLTGVRYEHHLKENLSWALDYRFSNVYSPDVYSLNNYNNRLAFEVRQVF